MKIILFILLGLIVLSLGSALFFLVKDDSQTKRVVYALTIRITLSIVVLIIVVLGYFLGWWTIHPTPF